MSNDEITVKLAGLREEIEAGCSAPVWAVPVDAATVLADVCRVLGLSDEQVRRVLGDYAYIAVCAETLEGLESAAMALPAALPAAA